MLTSIFPFYIMTSVHPLMVRFRGNNRGQFWRIPAIKLLPDSHQPFLLLLNRFLLILRLCLRRPRSQLAGSCFLQSRAERGSRATWPTSHSIRPLFFLRIIKQSRWKEDQRESGLFRALLCHAMKTGQSPPLYQCPTSRFTSQMFVTSLVSSLRKSSI